jgi:DHA2 family multidrug resistance protein
MTDTNISTGVPGRQSGSGQVEAIVGHPALTGAALVIVSILLGLANAIAVLDITIANVSIPHIAGTFGVSANEGTWVITSYAIAEAITVPLTGWLARRFGTVKVIVVSIGGFGLLSLLCGLASNFETLVLFRVLQGLFGGPMIPLSQTLLLLAFPKEKAGAAMGVWALGSVIGPVVGPILGGYICDNAGWPWIFYINVPFTIIAALFCWRLLRERETPTQRVPIDFVGLGLLVIWVGALQMVLDKGRDLDWFGSPFIVTLAVIAAAAFGLFLIWELTDKHPIVELRIFVTPGFAISVALLCMAFAGFFANEVLSPLWMQTNLGYTATNAGLAAFPHAVVITLLAAPVQRLMVKIDNRLLICTGLLLLAASLGWRTAFASNVTFGEIFFAQASNGVGLAFIALPLIPAVLGTLKTQDLAAGAGLMNFCRTTAMAFVAAIVTTVWSNSATENRVAILNQMPDIEPLAASGLTTVQQAFVLNDLIQGQSVMLATVHIYQILVVVMLVASAGIWLMPRRAPGVAAPVAGH